MSEEQIIEDLPQIVADTVAYEIANDQDRFLEKTYKSQQKVLFIKDDRLDVEVQTSLPNCPTKWTSS